MKATWHDILLYAILLAIGLFGFMACGSETLSFAWDRSTNATGYNFYFTSDSVFWPLEICSPRRLGNVTFYSISNLAEGVEYEFAVTATNSYGESAFSKRLTNRPALKARTVTLTLQSRTNLVSAWTNRLSFTLTNKPGVSNEFYRLKIP